MGYAKYVGRVGALAVTLGVGVAMATGIAYAEPSDSSSTSDSSTRSNSSATPSSSSTDGSPATSESPATTTRTTSTGRSLTRTASPATRVGAGRDDAPASVSKRDDSREVGSTDRPVSDTRKSRAADAADTSGEATSLAAAAVGQSDPVGEERSPLRATAAAVDAPVQHSTAATTFTEPTAPRPAARTVPQQRPTLVTVVSDFVTAMLRPLMDKGADSPVQMPALLAMTAVVRDEFERVRTLRTANPQARYTVTQIGGPSLVDPNPNVLVIGVDGVNLARILADPENKHFFALMDDATTGPSSIVGHTTISNPSWSAILTGVWGERTGVINNVFTPGTYDRWPTVFNHLETHNPNIRTTAIANWNVIADIADAGSIPADQIVFVPQVPGDTNWLLTDDAVGAATVTAIQNTPGGAPTFMFSYFVGVDENGHMYGGASPQYAEAIRNADENLGDILAAIDAWETANPDEGEWTIIVVTDHGHQPQQGFGHGFQSPDETSTFVIASGPDFRDGYMNLQYQIVDTTPTVLTLFGATSPGYFDGVSLTTRGGGDVDPVDLHRALLDSIAANGYPDIGTNVALGLRTVFATIPYYVYNLTYDAIAQLQAVADQGVFLISPLAGLAAVAVQLLGNGLYVVTNIPAQLVARLTGVTGASIFPLVPPPPSIWTPEQLTAPDLTLVPCGSGLFASTADSLCGVAKAA